MKTCLLFHLITITCMAKKVKAVDTAVIVVSVVADIILLLGRTYHQVVVGSMRVVGSGSGFGSLGGLS